MRRQIIMVSAAQFCTAIDQRIGEKMTMNAEQDRNALINQWRAAVRQLSAAKDEEATLRAQLVTTYFDPTKEKGTENLELGEGYKLKCVKKLSPKIDRQRIDDTLTRIEAFGERAKFLVERMFKWTPELSVSEWNNVNESAEGGDELAQKIVAEIIGDGSTVPVVVFTPGMPSLEFVEPKTK